MLKAYVALPWLTAGAMCLVQKPPYSLFRTEFGMDERKPEFPMFCCIVGFFLHCSAPAFPT